MQSPEEEVELEGQKVREASYAAKQTQYSEDVELKSVAEEQAKEAEWI